MRRLPPHKGSICSRLKLLTNQALFRLITMTASVAANAGRGACAAREIVVDKLSDIYGKVTALDSAAKLCSRNSQPNRR